MDQYNRGEIRNQFRAGDAALCVVEAYCQFVRHAPQRRAGGADAGDHLLVWRDGRPIQRSEVQAALMRAAEAQGVAPEAIGSHSLRFGGASALWAAYRDTGLVRRWGRWASDCYQSYLWDSKDAARGVAEAMAKADVAVM